MRRHIDEQRRRQALRVPPLAHLRPRVGADASAVAKAEMRAPSSSRSPVSVSAAAAAASATAVAAAAPTPPTLTRAESAGGCGGGGGNGDGPSSSHSSFFSPSLAAAIRAPPLARDELLATLLSPRELGDAAPEDVSRAYTQLYAAHAASVAQVRALQAELAFAEHASASALAPAATARSRLGHAAKQSLPPASPYSGTGGTLVAWLRVPRISLELVLLLLLLAAAIRLFAPPLFPPPTSLSSPPPPPPPPPPPLGAQREAELAARVVQLVLEALARQLPTAANAHGGN
jgi:hypothetical protein